MNRLEMSAAIKALIDVYLNDLQLLQNDLERNLLVGKRAADPYCDIREIKEATYGPFTPKLKYV